MKRKVYLGYKFFAWTGEADILYSSDKTQVEIRFKIWLKEKYLLYGVFSLKMFMYWEEKNKTKQNTTRNKTDLRKIFSEVTDFFFFNKTDYWTTFNIKIFHYKPEVIYND